MSFVPRLSSFLSVKNTLGGGGEGATRHLLCKNLGHRVPSRIARGTSRARVSRTSDRKTRHFSSPFAPHKDTTLIEHCSFALCNKVRSGEAISPSWLEGGDPFPRRSGVRRVADTWYCCSPRVSPRSCVIRLDGRFDSIRFDGVLEPSERGKRFCFSSLPLARLASSVPEGIRLTLLSSPPFPSSLLHRRRRGEQSAIGF